MQPLSKVTTPTRTHDGLRLAVSFAVCKIVGAGRKQPRKQTQSFAPVLLKLKVLRSSFAATFSIPAASLISISPLGITFEFKQLTPCRTPGSMGARHG